MNSLNSNYTEFYFDEYQSRICDFLKKLSNTSTNDVEIRLKTITIISTTRGFDLSKFIAFLRFVAVDIKENSNSIDNVLKIRKFIELNVDGYLKSNNVINLNEIPQMFYEDCFLSVLYMAI